MHVSGDADVVKYDYNFITVLCRVCISAYTKYTFFHNYNLLLAKQHVYSVLQQLLFIIVA